MVKKTSLAHLRGVCVRSDAGTAPPDDLGVDDVGGDNGGNGAGESLTLPEAVSEDGIDVIVDSFDDAVSMT